MCGRWATAGSYAIRPCVSAGYKAICASLKLFASVSSVGSTCGNCGGKLVRRKDDDPEAVRTRLRVYDDETAPVLRWYRDNGTRVATIDALGAVDDVTSRALGALPKA